MNAQRIFAVAVLDIMAAAIFWTIWEIYPTFRLTVYEAITFGENVGITLFGFYVGFMAWAMIEFIEEIRSGKNLE